MKAIQTVINQHIPCSRPSPHSKRWWTKELTDMKKDLARMAQASHRLCNQEWLLIHEEYHIKCNKVTTALKMAKKLHWMDWLDNMTGEEIQ